MYGIELERSGLTAYNISLLGSPGLGIVSAGDSLPRISKKSGRRQDMLVIMSRHSVC